MAESGKGSRDPPSTSDASRRLKTSDSQLFPLIFPLTPPLVGLPAISPDLDLSNSRRSPQTSLLVSTMNGNIDHSWGGDGLRERKNPQHGTYERHERHERHDEHGDQGNNAESEDLSREKELRKKKKKKKTVGKTPDGSGE